MRSFFHLCIVQNLLQINQLSKGGSQSGRRLHPPYYYVPPPRMHRLAYGKIENTFQDLANFTELIKQQVLINAEIKETSYSCKQKVTNKIISDEFPSYSPAYYHSS